jgi:uncharacterized protein
MDADVADQTQLRGLHAAVTGDSLEVVKLLVSRGADIDRPTSQYDGPMGFASHFGRREIAAFLAPLSRDVHNLTYLGFKDRVGELLAADPSLVNARHFRFGCTPLFVRRRRGDGHGCLPGGPRRRPAGHKENFADSESGRSQ